MARGRDSWKTVRLNPTDPAPPPAPSKAVHGITGLTRLLLWPFAILVRWWGMTLRFETPPEDVRNYTKRDVPVCMVLWHNRLFLATEIYRRWRRPRPLYALISASKDGAWLVAFFEMVGGMRAARGSSSRLGREAVSTLVDLQAAGHDIGITPDGPRGPCYEVKPGAVIVPRRTRVPLLLIGGDFQNAWRIRSWDRFYLPLPFSRVKMRCVLIENERLADRDAGVALIQKELLAINPDRAR
ncbi:MAG: hypothetical protein JWM35_1781, partial [Verrucomicrobia bacterium]|nr:hypothetical protein [Verrucomicrobiota bacterium]